MDNQIPVITIDGPSGTGKGTVSRQLADALDWHMLDSGALYRLLALAAERHRIALDNEADMVTLATHLDVQFRADNQSETRIFLEEEEVTDAIRTEAVGDMASRVAAIGAVRQALLSRQYAFRQPPGLVADGRDMGTVVFPDAVLKIYLTASPQARAERRYKQLKEKGISVSLSALCEDIARRDERDSQRAVAPLKAAPDALTIDTTELDIQAVFEHVLSLAQQRLE